MIRDLTPAEIAEHARAMAEQRAQMPPDVVQAIRTLRHWASMPDGLDEAMARAEAVRWFLQVETWP
ncbi:MAG TPA: hypothetical protein PKY87_12795 [Terricaulis sp.]|nr:hypothetical protein [Terricaulis sp.]